MALENYIRLKLQCSEIKFSWSQPYPLISCVDEGTCVLVLELRSCSCYVDYTAESQKRGTKMVEQLSFIP